VVADSYGGTDGGTVTVTVYATNTQPDRVVSVQLRPDGNKHVTLTGVSGITYVVQATAGLKPPVWVPVFTNTAPSTNVYFFDDLGATNFAKRYYRTVSQ